MGSRANKQTECQSIVVPMKSRQKERAYISPRDSYTRITKSVIVMDFSRTGHFMGRRQSLQ